MGEEPINELQYFSSRVVIMTFVNLIATAIISFIREGSVFDANVFLITSIVAVLLGGLTYGVDREWQTASDIRRHGTAQDRSHAGPVLNLSSADAELNTGLSGYLFYGGLGSLVISVLLLIVL